MLRAGVLLGCFSTLKMEVVGSFETSVHKRTTRRYISEDGNIHNLFIGFLTQSYFVKIFPWQTSCSRALADSQQVKEFPTLYVISKFITVVTTAHRCSHPERVKSNVHIRISYLQSNLILIFPYTKSSKWLLSFRFSNKIVINTFHLCHTYYMPSHW
jgi:hypothetical protein